MLCRGKRIRVGLSCRIKAKARDIEGKNKFCPRVYFDGVIGKYSVIGPDSRMTAKIGRYVSIGPNVKTVPASHPLDSYALSAVVYKKIPELVHKGFVETANDTMIGNDVWVGENVLIKGGISIGDGAVIGMGAVVTKDVPPYAIVAGCPARIIRYRFDDQTIEKLTKNKWWEKDLEELNLDSFLGSAPFEEKR